MARKKKDKFYSLAPILQSKAQYNIVIGERSNGKTYAALRHGLKMYVNRGDEIAIVRRWQDDFKGKRGAILFKALEENGEIEKLTNHEYTHVWYWRSAWYLCRYEISDNGGEPKRIRQDNPFAYAFAISAGEHDKSTAYPNVRTVIFDEFLTRYQYLPDEFVLFMNVLSTIIRHRDDVIIFMLGNTVNKYSPYFEEMGLTNIKNQKKGTIDIYNYGESKLRVAVEYCAEKDRNTTKSDVYFAFDNPRLNMITGHGNSWEIDLYPHCPCRYLPKEILFRYYIIFDRETLEAEIIQHEDLYFTFIHRKTTPIKDVENSLIYTAEYSARPNYRTSITKAFDLLGKKIQYFYKTDKVFYATNEVGEIVMNYLKWCNS